MSAAAWPVDRCMAPWSDLGRHSAVWPFCTRPRGHRGDHVTSDPGVAAMPPWTIASAEATLPIVARWSA